MSGEFFRSTWLVIFGLAVLGSAAAGQEAQAPVLDAAKKLEEALRAQIKGGNFDQAATAPAIAQAVSRVLAMVSKDGHIGFAYNPAQAEDMRRLQGQSDEDRRKVRERRGLEARRDDYGFREVERLEGNVGDLDFRMFASPDQAGPTAIAAMNFLAHCDAIMVDLRQNGGGDPAQIQRRKAEHERILGGLKTKQASPRTK